MQSLTEIKLPRIVTDEEYMVIMYRCGSHFANIRKIIENSGDKQTASILYHSGTMDVADTLIDNRKDLMSIGKACQNIILTGTDVIHEALILLMSWPFCRVSYIRRNYSTGYLEKCLEYLQENFSDRFFPSYFCDKYDAVIINGYPRHAENGIDWKETNLDFFQTKDRLCQGGIIYFAGAKSWWRRQLWYGYINDGYIKPFTLSDPLSNPHFLAFLTPSENKQEVVENIHLPGFRTESKIVVCTLALGDKYKRVVYEGHLTKLNYCKKHGYDFRHDEDVYDTERHPAWSKVKLFQKCMTEPYEWLIWLDADSFIMNPDIRLEDMIEEMTRGKDITMCRDHSGAGNAGVMFIRNTPWVKDFFQEVYFPDRRHGILFEQDPINLMYDANEMNAKEHINMMPFSEIHRYNATIENYSTGDFLIHFMGCNTSLQDIMEKYCPIRMEKDTDESYTKRMDFLSRLRKGEYR